MFLTLIKLFSLGSLLGICYGFSFVYIQVNTKKTPFYILFYCASKVVLLLILFYLLHLFKIRSIIFIVAFILSFWTFIIKYKH